MNLHGIFPTEEELKEMIQMVDRNSNGTIDCEEFVQMMLDITKAIPEGEDDIEQAFKIFDKVNTFYFIDKNSPLNSSSGWRRSDHCGGDQSDDDGTGRESLRD